MNLRTIIIILSLLVLIATALGSHLSYLSLETSTQNIAHHEAESVVEKTSNNIDAIILETQQAAKALAGHDELTKVLISKDNDNLSNANIILDLFHSSFNISVSYLMDSEGKTIASSNRNDSKSFVGKNYSFRPYFREAMTGKASVYMALGVTSNKRGLYIGYPVYGNDKKVPIGVAVIKTTFDKLTDELNQSYDGIMNITGPHNFIFASSNKEFTSNFMFPVSAKIKNEILETKQFGKGPWRWVGITMDAHHREVTEQHTDEDSDTEFHPYEQPKVEYHAFDKAGNEYHMHMRNIHTYSGWKAVYLHEHTAASKRLAAPIFKTAKIVLTIIMLIMLISVTMLYQKASSDLTARQKLEERLREISITDELTDLYNRRGFFELAGHQYYSATRSNSPMTLYYLDIDDMKKINDKYGHSAGDNALKDVAKILRTTFRKSDIIARLGGDEFAILMIRTTDHKSENISNRLENIINEHNLTAKRPFKLSLSIGEVTYDHETEMDFENFIQAADELMYKKKQNKQNA